MVAGRTEELPVRTVAGRIEELAVKMVTDGTGDKNREHNGGKPNWRTVSKDWRQA